MAMENNYEKECDEHGLSDDFFECLDNEDTSVKRHKTTVPVESNAILSAQKAKETSSITKRMTFLTKSQSYKAKVDSVLFDVSIIF